MEKIETVVATYKGHCLKCGREEVSYDPRDVDIVCGFCIAREKVKTKYKFLIGAKIIDVDRIVGSEVLIVEIQNKKYKIESPWHHDFDVEKIEEE